MRGKKISKERLREVQVPQEIQDHVKRERSHLQAIVDRQGLLFVLSERVKSVFYNVY
ncbi:hypothetical protein J5U23_01933 [Saccharolobus shibatae B12]|uniref:Uncharacterized protein n=1 Tax=Saccharolobus shibatae (strain ATCC 51178 / DSM 5389 / JCM 8931 / NBRC 15437 / B12) TaxID=523848 RepID=A0A8F5BPN7_SACSH|nr:hypothetical protein J5U23_01933 [Saccharolobus shibatae B12]